MMEIPATATSKAGRSQSHLARGFPREFLAENALLVTLVALLGALLLLVGPALLVQDSWLALVAGREIVQHGVPAHDSIVVMTHGARWVDQQWLAQLFFY